MCTLNDRIIIYIRSFDFLVSNDLLANIGTSDIDIHVLDRNILLLYYSSVSL